MGSPVLEPALRATWAALVLTEPLTSGTPVLVSLAPFSALKGGLFLRLGEWAWSPSWHLTQTVPSWEGRVSLPGPFARSLCQDPSLCALSRHFVNGDMRVSWQMYTLRLCCS